jgi:ubiquinone/menaquinone biosynthesis C-methylase UbiE
MFAQNSIDFVVPPIPVTQRWQSDKVAQSYDKERFTSWAGRLFNYLSHRSVQRALAAIPGPIPSIMDVPCGTGRFLDLLSTLSDKTIGADVSLQMLQVAAKTIKHPERIQFLRTDIKHIPFADGYVDTLVCLRFMMHPDASDRREALREMGRVAARYVVVEYGCTSPWLRMRRRVKRCVHRLQGRKVDFVRAVPWNELLTDIHVAGLKLAGRFWTARGLSESVILLLTK